MKLRDFQKKLIIDGDTGHGIFSMKKNLDHALEQSSKKIIAFQSPTGSGKTIMMSKLIEEYKHRNVSFLWVAPSTGNLHLQSLKKLNKITGLGLTFDDLNNNEIPKGEVLFLGWSKANKKKDGNFDNIIMKNEKRDLPQVIANTKTKRKLVIIVDESHIGQGKPSNSQELLDEVFKGNVEIHVSATNTSREKADYVTVADNLKDEIIDDGIIKKEIKLERDWLKGVDVSLSKCLEAANKKREEIKNEFQKCGEEVNPLVLIQVGNSTTARLQEVEEELKKLNKTYDNNKVGLWMDGKKLPSKEIIDRIDDNNNEIEFLIFKQAIATGWDCPRSHILVQLRNIGSETFEVQILGRISRNPVLKKMNNEILDNGYVYSDLESFSIKEDTAYSLKDLSSKLKKDIQFPQEIKTSYIENYGQNEIDGRLFHKHLGENKFKDILKEINNLKINEENLKKHYHDLTIDLIDTLYFKNKEDGIKEDNNIIEANIPDYKIESTAKEFIKNLLIDYKTSSNVEYIISKIDDLYTQDYDLYKIILSNKDFFEVAIDKTISTYNKNVASSYINYELQDQDFSFQEKEYFSSKTHKEFDYDKYIYEDCYLNHESKIEIEFSKYLEKNKNIEWWYQSGTTRKVHLGIPYKRELDNKTRIFYPDFIIHLNNGKYLIVDTKDGGIDALGGKDIINKTNALISFCKKHQHFIGGIVVYDKKDKDFKIFSNNDKEYNYKKGSLHSESGWKRLNELINQENKQNGE